MRWAAASTIATCPPSGASSVRRPPTITGSSPSSLASFQARLSANGKTLEEASHMFLTRKHLSRRTVLKGAGAAIALPLLDAMIPARTLLAQTAAASAPRLGFVYFPHGALQEEWTPTRVGRDLDFPFILKPLEPMREHVTVVSG